MLLIFQIEDPKIIAVAINCDDILSISHATKNSCCLTIRPERLYSVKENGYYTVIEVMGSLSEITNLVNKYKN